MKKCLFLLMVLFTAASLAQADLIVHYSMEEHVGAIVDQVGGETAEPVDEGHAYVRTGPDTWGNAIGVTANCSWQLDDPESAELNDLANDFTVAAWVNVDSALRAAKSGAASNNDRVIGDDVAWDGDAWAFGIQGGTIIFTKNGIVDAISSTVVPTDEWAHIAAVVNSATGIEFYLNGVKMDTNGNTANCNLGNDVFGIGRGYGNAQEQWFPGSIDEVRVYDTVLTEAEIADLLVGPSDRAILVAPEAGSITVIPETAQLQWSAPGDITAASYNLSIRANDPNMTDSGTVTVTDATSPYTPASLANETTYYWTVDTVESGTGTVYPGTIWYFTTTPDVPLVVTDPVSQTAAAGTDVELMVEAVNADSYQWYFNGEILTGETSSTLIITAIDIADEGIYFCEVTNSGGSVDSATATVLTQRIINHYKLDDNMEDSVAGRDGEGLAFDPPYAEGVDGSSATFAGDNAVLVANDPNIVLNEFTFALWAKVDGGSAHRAAISNRDDGPARGFILYAVPANQWVFWNGTGSGWSGLGNEPVVNGEWIHLAGSMDKDGVKKFYVNGVKSAEAVVAYVPNSVQDMLIGAGRNENPADYYFHGQIDDVRLYNYAVDPIDIALLFTDIQGGDVCYEFPVYDLNEDCYVNLSDFALMASQWLECKLVPAENCL